LGCVVAALLSIALVPLLDRSGGNSASPRSQTPPTPPAWKGAAAAFYALHDGKVWLVTPVPGGQQPSSGSDSDTNHPAVSVGSADGRRAYAALHSGACQTTFETHYSQPGTSVVARLNTVQERVEPIPLAVSPTGNQIAFGVDRVRRGRRCVPVTGLVVMNLKTHRSKFWSAPQADTIRSVQWSSDGTQLAYLVGPKCAYLSYSTSACRFTGGTYVLDPVARSVRLGTKRPLLPLLGRHRSDVYAPVFWWRSQWATVFNGELRAIASHGRLGKTLASGLPTEPIDSISSTPDGNHFVIETTSHVYRWDRGELEAIPGGWSQPAW
jgi:hypothetical protein